MGAFFTFWTTYTNQTTTLRQPMNVLQHFAVDTWPGQDFDGISNKLKKPRSLLHFSTLCGVFLHLVRLLAALNSYLDKQKKSCMRTDHDECGLSPTERVEKTDTKSHCSETTNQSDAFNLPDYPIRSRFTIKLFTTFFCSWIVVNFNHVIKSVVWKCS
jgi:hypothetical protein